MGDSIDDILCGGNAGNVTCLLNNDKNNDIQHKANLNVDRLEDICSLLLEGFHVDSFNKHLS